MSAALNGLGSELFGSLVQLSVELAALAALVLLAGRLLRIQSPALRHFLWVAVLLKPIVAVTISSPWTVFTPLISSLEPGWLAAGHAPPVLSIEAQGMTGAAIPTIGGSPSSLSFVGWVAGCWVLGSALLMGWMLIGYGVLWRLRRQARVYCAGPLFGALRKARLALDVGPGVEVATSRSIHSPIVLGIVRPLIVVPDDLVERLRADELEMVLMHELAHVRRYDNFTLLIQRLITAALFFHPAVWLCGRMLRQEAEQACDDLVLYATGRSEDYARSLTSVIELANLKTHLKRRISIMKVFAAVESDLALRIRRALRGGVRRMGTKSRVLAAILLCGVCGMTLPYSGIADAGDEVDWETVKSAPPEEWSEELKEQIAAAGHDVEAIAERARQSQAEARDKADSNLDAVGRRIRAAVQRGDMTPEEGRKKMEEARRAMDSEPSREDWIWQAAMSTDPDEWSDRLKAAILELEPGRTIEEIAEFIRQRQQAARIKRDRDDGIDWEIAKSMPPEEWSDELKAQITAAGHDVETVAERVRQWQAQARDKADPDLDAIGRRIRAAVERGDMTPEEGRKKMEAARQAAGEGGGDRLREFQRGVVARAMAAPPEEWSDELKAAIARAGWDLDEFTEGIRQRQAAVRTEQSRDDGIDWRAVMATAPEEWPEELKAQITAAGYDLEEIAEGIRQRRAAASESSDQSSTTLESQTEEKTGVEESSWGRIKKEQSDSK